MVIVDASIIMHANYHIQKRINPGSGDEYLAKCTVNQIQNIAFKSFPNSSIVLALDSKNNFRKELYSGYKANRAAPPFDRSVIHEVLRDHFECYEIDGYEADDIAYILSRNGGILVSNDDDYKLMLNKQGVYLYKYRLDKLFDYDPKEYLIQRTLKICEGCDTDNVPNIKRQKFGIKLITEFVETFGDQTLENLYEFGFIENYELNEKLVTYDINEYPCPE